MTSLAIAYACLVLAQQPGAGDAVSFRTQVAPILAKKCLGCHNDQKAENGLNIKTYALLRKGGKALGDGIIEPGDPDGSYLIDVLLPEASPRMPLKLPPLPDGEIEILRRWIAEGAKFDAESESETTLASLVNPLEGLPEVRPSVATSGAVTATAFSSDAKHLAAAVGVDVFVYETETGKELFRLSDPEGGAINAVKFVPVGNTLVACGGRPGMHGTVVVWDLSNQQKRHALRGHADAILGADLAPDGRTLVTCSYDRLIKLWDIQEGKELRTLKEHTDAVFGVAFSPDATRLASAGGDRTVKVWDSATGRRVQSFSDATAEQYTVAFSPDGQHVFAAGVDRVIRSWRVGTADDTLERSAFAHDAPVLRLDVAAGKGLLVSSSEDRLIKVWDVETLEVRKTLPARADWPLALATTDDGALIAVGLYDGSLSVLDGQTDAAPRVLREAPKPVAVTVATEQPPPPAEATKPQLLTNATLAPPSPRSAMRGTKVKVTLSGNGVGSAHAIQFYGPGIEATLVPVEKPTPTTAAAELTISADASPGLHAFVVRTEQGTTNPTTFAVSAHPESAEKEPNDDADQALDVSMPTILLGTIEKANDVDLFRFDAPAGKTIVAELMARPLGSSLSGRLSLVDDAGKEVAMAERTHDGREAVLMFTPEQAGRYRLRVSDTDLGGSGNHHYRITLGNTPYLTSVFPPAVAVGARGSVTARGVNLGEVVTLPVGGEGLAANSIHGFAASVGGEALATGGVRYVAAAGDQPTETEPNDENAGSNRLTAPGGVSGTIGAPGDVDQFQFETVKGQPLVIEVYGRRLGSPIDPSIELLDAEGRIVPRAVLRPLRQTQVAFRDHPSTGRNIRLVYPWTGFAQGDYVLMGREVSRIAELPRNLDDDAVFWGLGSARNNTGDRIALLGTTPEHHPQGQAITQVEIHPPGTTFPAGGLPATTITYRNDDGGPGFGKDSMLIFDPPADGRYSVRVDDVRGLGGTDFTYHVVARQPKPDFSFSVLSENPNIPRGSSIVVPVNITRMDGFMDAVEVTVADLPPGITATSARIEPELHSAELLLTAAADAPAFSDANWTLHARSVGESETIAHDLDPGGVAGGRITVVPAPNLKVYASQDRVELVPGQEASLTLRIERGNGFAGRVPIDLRNLPYGVRVLNIGLNGVLVTEQQTERAVTLYAEPWVKPQERPFFAVAQCEAAGTSDSSSAINVVILPAPGAQLAGER